MFGSDFEVDSYGDLIFTTDGDISVVIDEKCIAQDIAEGARLAIGSVFYDLKAGSTIPLALNDNELTTASIARELKRLAIEDERVDPSSVQTIEDGFKVKLMFSPVGEVTKETLNFDLNDILKRLNNE